MAISDRLVSRARLGVGLPSKVLYPAYLVAVTEVTLLPAEANLQNAA